MNFLQSHAQDAKRLVIMAMILNINIAITAMTGTNSWIQILKIKLNHLLSLLTKNSIKCVQILG
jgi:hypothetical protein